MRAMGAPPVHYVKTQDGYNIAYGVSGEGLPLLFLPGTFDHVQLAWQYPELDAWLEGLAAKFRLVQFDPRGSGLSTRGLNENHSADAYQVDIAAVVERLGLERFVIFGIAPAMRIAVRYAFEHPERVLGLVCQAAGVGGRTPALFQILPSQDWEWFLRSLTPRHLSPEEAQLRMDLMMQAYRQDDFVRKMAASLPTGTRECLEGLRVPALVLHPRDHALVSHEEAAEVAQLSRGSLVMTDGDSAFGNAPQGISAIETFVAGIAGLSSTAAAPDGLSPREVEVLRLIAAGRSNQQIATELVISLNTVQRHVSNILNKAGVANRTEAASYAHLHALT
jgi:DNA-binding CsgD family transcriptional regulator/pimeloyl-ACP methyl ester carboxylesterase